jgi:hypothetical protein
MTTLDTMKAYIDTTKTFIQLSSGGLVLPLAIRTQFLELFHTHSTFAPATLVLACASWLCFLVAIGAGALFQYAAVKFVEYEASPSTTHVPRVLNYLVREKGPGVAYGIMISAFYLGAILVVLYSFVFLGGK